MAKPIKNLTDMEIDEISLVDKGANQHARITIAKRAPEEDVMPDLFDKDQNPVSEDSLALGDIVFDAEGNAYEYVEDDGSGDIVEDRKEEKVGKSAFFDKQTKITEADDFAKSVMEELSKAFSDDDRDKVIAKALGRVGDLEAQLQQVRKSAQDERELRLTREYVSKAAEYNVPIDPNELGPVLYRMAETMSYDDCAVIAKALESVGEILFEETGYQGGGDNNDIMSRVESLAAEEIGKSAEGGYVGAPSAAQIAKVFDENPMAYDEYLASQRARF